MQIAVHRECVGNELVIVLLDEYCEQTIVYYHELQAGISCEESSESDLIQNFILKLVKEKKKYVWFQKSRGLLGPDF